MDTVAIVIEEPGKLALNRVALVPPEDGDVVVDIEWSGISTGTERLLWTGDMPPFPGMDYPLVPGYESIGRIVESGPAADLKVGQRVFVPGATCYVDAHGLFGGAARRVVVSSDRVVPIEDDLGERGVLIALAATAHHALSAEGARPPDLIIGHGTLGRLLARLAVAKGFDAPTVWERAPDRSEGADDYPVVHPDDDGRHDYSSIYDASGDSSVLDTLIGRMGFGGEIVLAGFYSQRLSFAFAPAFMREARIRIAAEWKKSDIQAVRALMDADLLSLDNLITHTSEPEEAAAAYRTAFGDPACLKMVLDWRAVQ